MFGPHRAINRLVTESSCANNCLMDFSGAWFLLADKTVLVLALEGLEELVVGGNGHKKNNPIEIQTVSDAHANLMCGFVWKNIMRGFSDCSLYNLHTGQTDTV